ncbi:hypothetical protein OKA04_12200 [Luteolibacter flavescens]|uniref:DNA-binding protein n=2 Tax=Luteolibacter flavescens TaxID=1859460 RepID=A0ABT3FPI9_9BACT|nr:hypothetical protein [Luteolibacter flavescens]
MTFSPEQEARVIAEAARIIAEQAIREAGSAKRLVTFPIPTICQMTGLSRHTVPQRMPITETTPGKHGVTLENLENYLDGKTIWPGQKRLASTGK